MRYVGQGHEIPVPLPARVLTVEDVAAIRARYDAEYTRFYDRPVPGSDVEIMSYAVVVATMTDDAGAVPPSGDGIRRRQPRRPARGWCATRRPARSRHGRCTIARRWRRASA